MSMLMSITNFYSALVARESEALVSITSKSNRMLFSKPFFYNLIKVVHKFLVKLLTDKKFITMSIPERDVTSLSDRYITQCTEKNSRKSIK